MGRHVKEMTPAEAIRQLRQVEVTLLEDVQVRGHAMHDLLEVTAGLVREVREFYQQHAPAKDVPIHEDDHEFALDGTHLVDCRACLAERHFAQ